MSRVALAMLLDGNAEALAAYHAGDRHGPLVSRPTMNGWGLVDCCGRGNLCCPGTRRDCGDIQYEREQASILKPDPIGTPENAPPRPGRAERREEIKLILEYVKLVVSVIGFGALSSLHSSGSYQKSP